MPMEQRDPTVLLTLPRFHVQQLMLPRVLPQLEPEYDTQLMSEVDADCNTLQSNP